MTSYRSSALRLFCVGLALIGIGLGMAQDVQAQGPTQASPTPSAVVPTRIPSIFDTPAASPTPGAVIPTRIPSIFDTPAASPTPGVVMPTRIPSIFDAPPAQPDTGAPTRIPSIFDTPQTTNVIRWDGDEPPPRSYCLSCHASPFLQLRLESGEVISVAVDEDEYRASVHGQHGADGYRCIRCHVGMNEYPHEPFAGQTARDLTIDLSTGCARCHPGNYNETLDGIHAVLLAGGNQNAAVCSDCHTGHAVSPLRDRLTRERLPDANVTSVSMCADCHAEVYDRYASSVHGSALLAGSQDTPTCATCHGVHETHGPSDTAFRLFSPQLCATCHADQELMARYDISTDVFDTYVADFHGTTVTIFQNTAPGQAFNAPVCVDCHGVHTIVSVNDATSPLLKENLVSVCQRCHPSATTNFPDAWLSHYAPTFDRAPLVALANAIYAVLIPVVIGGLGLFVASDIRRRRSKR